jgi:uncharacterized protein DUF6714
MIEPDDEEDDEQEKVSREIARAIESAFATVPYPGDDRIVGASAHWESPDVLEAFRGKHWREISLDVLFTYRVSLGQLTPEAFHFYVPAALIAALLHSDATDTLRENLFSWLTPPDVEGYRQGWFASRRALFDAPQKAAIRRFVELYVEVERSYPDPGRGRALAFWRNEASGSRALTPERSLAAR